MPHRIILIALLQAAAVFAQGLQQEKSSELAVMIGKSAIVDSDSAVKRISVANPEIAEAICVSPREIVLNGKSVGETSLLIWEGNGIRRVIDIKVVPNPSNLEAIRRELESELPGQQISVTSEGANIMLRGSAADTGSADRALSIASLGGKVTNLLHVSVPQAEPQIMLRVRFANIDRSVASELAMNLISTGAGNTPGLISTQQYAPPAIDKVQKTGQFTISDALNIFLYRPDLNLGATIKALEAKSLVEILAEPNLLTMSGKSASFLAGGEFPFPTLQGGGNGIGQVTVQFREFGIRVQFLPTVTPRGTVRLVVTPEVSSLDAANGLTVQGFTVPGLATRRVQTEVELADHQSFVIAGLMDNRVTESFSRIPGLASIPVLGKLFQSRSFVKNNSELIIIVTPEIVDPIAVGSTQPALSFPKPFLKVPPMVGPEKVASPASGNVPGDEKAAPPARQDPASGSGGQQ